MLSLGFVIACGAICVLLIVWALWRYFGYGKEYTPDFTDEYWFENLNLDNLAHNRVARAIGRHYPGLVPLYRAIYRDGDNTFWKELAHDIADYCTQHGIAFRDLFH